jgi:hypothetical protein
MRWCVTEIFAQNVLAKKNHVFSGRIYTLAIPQPFDSQSVSQSVRWCNFEKEAFRLRRDFNLKLYGVMCLDELAYRRNFPTKWQPLKKGENTLFALFLEETSPGFRTTAIYCEKPHFGKTQFPMRCIYQTLQCGVF